MKKNPKDRHLDVPAEANRDKHINFVALENQDRDPGDMTEKGRLSPVSKRNKKKKGPDGSIINSMR